jgi:CDP-paratose 2-epimerase
VEEFAKAPRAGEVYNLGGGRANSISVLEAIARIEEMTGKKIHTVYSETPRVGDHICYISDLRKFRGHFPKWGITRDVAMILREIAEGEAKQRKGVAGGGNV